MPAIHPFNPLPPLRLAVAGGATRDTVRVIFDHLYGHGRLLDSDEAIADLGRRIGVDDAMTRLSDQDVKDVLKANTDEAIAKEVFGVRTFVVAGEAFWGADATEMLRDYLKNPRLFESVEVKRPSTMPMGRRRL